VATENFNGPGRIDIPGRIILEIAAPLVTAAKHNIGKAPKTLRLWGTESGGKR